jgi:N-acetyl-gamma-glutamyl-phosphate reductase
LLRPLLDAGWIPSDWPITIHGISGYSGGGKGLIAEFEAPTPGDTNDAYRSYGLTLKHKHVPEMRVNAAVSHDPLFSPAVGRFAQGMIVEVPLQLWAMPRNPAVSDLRATLEKRYAGEAFVEVVSEAECAALQADRAGAAGYVAGLDPEALNGTNRMRLFVFGNESRSQVRLLAQLDNLGKGASGAAVQNLNLMLGLEETAGL